MSIPDEVLMAYADGELDANARTEVEHAMAVDPRLARRVEEHRALRNKLRSSYDPVLAETIPDRLVAAARSGGVVVPLRPKRASTPNLPYWGAIAASFVVGALVWRFAAELYSSGPIVERGGELLAAGTLDTALSHQLVRDLPTGSQVQIGLSFRSRSGNYCRTFQLLEDSDLAGLACREHGRWRLEVLAHNASAQAGNPQFRPAGSSLPPAVVQAVDATMAGEPLDSQAEARARTNQWQPK